MSVCLGDFLCMGLCGFKFTGNSFLFFLSVYMYTHVYACLCVRIYICVSMCVCVCVSDCISHSTNTIGRGMNPIIHHPAMGK